MVLDSPDSVTTMAADLRDESQTRPPAPSLSISNPVRAAMQQLDYRVAELDRLQTDTASSSSSQPTTTELQLHQETAYPLRDPPTGASYDGPPNRTIECVSRRPPTGPRDRAESARSSGQRIGRPAAGHRAVDLWLGATQSPGPGRRGHVYGPRGLQQSSTLSNVSQVGW